MRNSLTVEERNRCNMLGVMQASDACCVFFPSKNVLNVFTVMDIGAL